MDSQQFLSAIAPALTDADARAKFLADPKAALAEAGLDLPKWVQVTAVEGEKPAMTITLPPMLDPDAELSDEALESVSGGCSGGCAYCGS